MSDEAALLAAIRAKPRDDAPRLVYADWLDEHGYESRAAYIRAMVRDLPVRITCRVTIEPDRYEGDDVVMRPTWTVCTKRPLCLFDHDQTIAMLPEPGMCGRGALVRARRGFVEVASMSRLSFRHVALKLAAHPLARVRLIGIEPVEGRMAGQRAFIWTMTLRATSVAGFMPL
jgi:uncharacterized protein (TIGR02996 family)